MKFGLSLITSQTDQIKSHSVLLTPTTIRISHQQTHAATDNSPPIIHPSSPTDPAPTPSAGLIDHSAEPLGRPGVAPGSGIGARQHLNTPPVRARQRRVRQDGVQRTRAAELGQREETVNRTGWTLEQTPCLDLSRDTSAKISCGP